MPRVELYTDGAAKGNPGPGGYGAILRHGSNEKELSGGFYHTTNNRMELLAVIVGLEALKVSGCEVTVVSDSKYVVDAFLKNWIGGWKRRGWAKVKNPDLWKRLLRAMEPHQVQFTWIKGHNDHPENERCDRLAVAASLAPTEQDFGYAPDDGKLGL
ncbi:MAG: ribonuclease HI [Bacteroidetes bacterium]|jgi:ribonuclease HI|nr:MAG: ribonuclease HI [Cryomorphaceae bacterium BACL23 MAG-120924-bin60]MBL6627556.1 ribonuclease HI [Cryomorphaceae bacterium]MDA0363805.1 ribonuclease HI [Bacteroidota bacterium]MDA0828970.1 ribonuclease HI [Bacteroidota bacterium]MDA1199697.1 ribonuclease HI [Bacteroidota bacterium]